MDLWLFDVDDPSSHEAPLDDESKVKDNRGDGLADEGPGYLGFAMTDANGVVVFTRRVSSQPGDNYRAVASLKGSASEDFVGVKQDDGTNARVYLRDKPQGNLTTNPVPEANAEIVSSPLLTVWRHLTIERDHMAAPPNNEVFETQEPRLDYDPGGALPDLDITMAQQYFRAGYIEIRDAGALNTRPEFAWVHNWDNEAAMATALPTLAATTRDVANSKAYWAVQVMAAYEPDKGHDYDPPAGPPGPNDPTEEGYTEGVTIGNTSVVFGEVVRDVVIDGHPNYWEWDLESLSWVEVWLPYTINHGVTEDLNRTTYHELVHQFGLVHADPYDANNPGDQGILDEEVAFVGDANYIALNPAQLDKIRLTQKPG